MKKTIKVEPKATAKKANSKVAVKKIASTAAPRLAANHNETLLIR